MEARSTDQTGNASTGANRLEFSDATNDPLLCGWEVHGFLTYSKLTYPELLSKQSERMLLPQEIYAVLKNADLYVAHQSFYQTTEKWLLNRDEFLLSPWKNCTKNFKKIPVQGIFCIHEYSDTSGKKFRYTLVSADVDTENSIYLVQSLPAKSLTPKRKRPEPLEEVDGFLCELLNSGIDCLSRAKKTKDISEAFALRDEAVRFVSLLTTDEVAMAAKKDVEPDVTAGKDGAESVQDVMAGVSSSEPVLVVREEEGDTEPGMVVMDKEPVLVVMDDKDGAEPV